MRVRLMMAALLLPALATAAEDPAWRQKVAAIQQEGSRWNNRPVAELIAEKGAPDEIVPAWLCLQAQELMKSQAYLDDSIYAKVHSTSCSSNDRTGEYYDTYHYAGAPLEMGKEHCTLEAHVDAQKIIRGVAIGCFTPHDQRCLSGLDGCKR